ncbi:hypothetical protein D3C76_1709190 [compost metagenome]
MENSPVVPSKKLLTSSINSGMTKKSRYPAKITIVISDHMSQRLRFIMAAPSR